MQTQIRIDRDVPLETRDNIVLRSDVYRPDDGQRHPAILIRTPYNKLMVKDYSLLNLIDTISAGYVVVFQDVRGRFASDGSYDGGDVFRDGEASDGYDSVEWVSSQPWCDGNVGTAGISYMGSLQWILASENPPHLKAIAPWMCGTPGGEPLFTIGVIGINEMVSWTARMGMDVATRLEKQGKDVSLMRKMLNQAVSNPHEVYNFLPLKDVPHFDFSGVREIWQNRVLKAIPGPEYEEKATWLYDQVTVPCDYVSGWYDLPIWGIFHNFQTMRETGGSEIARGGQHLLVGPWLHGQITNSLGDIHFGAMADVRGSQVNQYQLAFFNKYLLGVDIQLPSVRYFVMGRNTWRNAETWPLPETHWQRFFLHSRGRANTASGNGTASQEEPGQEPPDIYVYDPLNPVPTTGGKGSGGENRFVFGPLEQSRIERRDDVLCYTTSELKEDIEITGPLELHLIASTSAIDTDFTAKLCDVYSDGLAYNVADGMIRTKYRKSVFKPEPIIPGETYHYVINMGHTSQLFRKGHRIRIDISSSNFPAWDRNMNTGNPLGEDSNGIQAIQTIYHQSQHFSYIDLPIIIT